MGAGAPFGQIAGPAVDGHNSRRPLMKVLIVESAAMLAIGDGVLGALFPVQHSTRWEFGPEPWRNFMRMWAKHPELTRAISLLQVAGGVVLASRLRSTPAK